MISFTLHNHISKRLTLQTGLWGSQRFSQWLKVGARETHLRSRVRNRPQQLLVPQSLLSWGPAAAPSSHRPSRTCLFMLPVPHMGQTPLCLCVLLFHRHLSSLSTMEWSLRTVVIWCCHWLAASIIQVSRLGWASVSPAIKRGLTKPALSTSSHMGLLGGSIEI